MVRLRFLVSSSSSLFHYFLFIMILLSTAMHILWQLYFLYIEIHKMHLESIVVLFWINCGNSILLILVRDYRWGCRVCSVLVEDFRSNDNYDSNLWFVNWYKTIEHYSKFLCRPRWGGQLHASAFHSVSFAELHVRGEKYRSLAMSIVFTQIFADAGFFPTCIRFSVYWYDYDILIHVSWYTTFICGNNRTASNIRYLI